MYSNGFVIAWLLRKSQSARITTLEADNARIQQQVSLLETERAHLITRSGSSEAELNQCMKSKQETFYRMETSTEMKQSDLDNAQKLGFRPAIATQKDDLKLISGIGLFIEKKLNNLGIYTYEQISEFSSDTIHRVTDAIEFFPGRIERDHWVDRAHHLMRTKVS